ncbi:DUF6249 domain-containing protein [Tunicatimonas pelagia]|uniref:DUF6249 domain-containing protein n=1 Tax=Tunicatimonas pelagia TaxID=931531 RepID=UPI002666F6C7|nr:DUF6249 domain-containing protein [Tunicatimonas pelagia]WKN42368.1 hypothetical protein P0M28_25360 [Tunicatimonas pelagia]
MNDGLVGAIIVGTMFFGIVSIIKVITDYQLRRKMIQLGHVDRESIAILRKQRNNRMESLKWGLIILFAGIGFMIISFPGIDLDSPLPFGIMAVSIAIGFLSYFAISKRMLEAENKENERINI